MRNPAAALIDTQRRYNTDTTPIRQRKTNDQSDRNRALSPPAGGCRLDWRHGVRSFLPAPGPGRPVAAVAAAAVGVRIWTVFQLGRRVRTRHSGVRRLSAVAVRRRARDVAAACDGRAWD